MIALVVEPVAFRWLVYRGVANMPPPPPKGGTKEEEYQYKPQVIIRTSSFKSPSGGLGVNIVHCQLSTVN